MFFRDTFLASKKIYDQISDQIKKFQMYCNLFKENATKLTLIYVYPNLNSNATEFVTIKNSNV